MIFIRSLPYLVALMAAVFVGFVLYRPFVEYAETVGANTTAPGVYTLIIHFWIAVICLTAGCLTFWWFKRPPKHLR